MSNRNWSNSEELSDDQLENIVGGVTGASGAAGASGATGAVTSRQKSESDTIESVLAGLHNPIPQSADDMNVELAVIEAKLKASADQDLKHHDDLGTSKQHHHDDTITKAQNSANQLMQEGEDLEKKAMAGLQIATGGSLNFGNSIPSDPKMHDPTKSK